MSLKVNMRSLSVCLLLLLFESIEAKIWATNTEKDYYATKEECEGYANSEMLELRNQDINEEFHTYSKLVFILKAGKQLIN